MSNVKNKLHFCFLFFFSIGILLSQQKEIAGEINNTKDIEGIHILNVSSRLNTLTDTQGKFKIRANVNDTLFVSAIAYVPELFIITKEVYHNAKIEITLKDLVNELDEVKVGNQLTGNLPVDAENNNPESFELRKDLSFEKMEFDYEFTPDKYSSFKKDIANDAYFNGQKQNDGVKLQEIIPAIVKYFRRNREPAPLPKLQNEEVVNFLKEKYTNEVIAANFKIQPTKVTDFIYYAAEQGLSQELLEENNELMLIQFLYEQAISYNEQQKKK